MNIINYSIIIPHYEIENLLVRCLNSIEYRDDVEVIVVDDASREFHTFNKTDYPYVRFIELKDNKGAGYCRNIGIKEASGRWLIFADADDFFLSSCLQKFDEYLNSDNDVIYFNFDSVNSDNINIASGEYRQSVIDTRKGDDEYINNYLRYVFGPPWAKMVLRKFVTENNITFDECYKHNDTMFSLKIGTLAQHITWDNRIIYANTYRENSITTTVEQNIKRYVDCVYDVEKRYREFAKTHKIKIMRWRLFNCIEYSFRSERNTVRELLKYLWRNNLFLYVLLRLPRFTLHRIVCRHRRRYY